MDWDYGITYVSSAYTSTTTSTFSVHSGTYLKLSDVVANIPAAILSTSLNKILKDQVTICFPISRNKGLLRKQDMKNILAHAQLTTTKVIKPNSVRDITLSTSDDPPKVRTIISFE